MARYDNPFDMAKGFYEKHLKLLHESKGNDEFWENMSNDAKYFTTKIQISLGIAVAEELKRIYNSEYRKS